MRCSNCNYENKSIVAFCVNCGMPLTPVANGTISKSKGKSYAKTKSVILTAAQVVFYLLIIAVMMFVTFYEKGVKVQSSYSTKSFKEFSFISVMMNLISGGEKYNPTTISIIIGLSAVLLIFGSVLFWLATSVTRCIGKGCGASYTIAVVMSALNLICLCVALPLAVRFSGNINLIYSREANYALSEIKSITSVWTFVAAAIVVVLIIIERIIAVQKKKFERQIKE